MHVLFTCIFVSLFDCLLSVVDHPGLTAVQGEVEFFKQLAFIHTEVFRRDLPLLLPGVAVAVNGLAKNCICLAQFPGQTRFVEAYLNICIFRLGA